jgi:hypothetical protein
MAYWVLVVLGAICVLAAIFFIFRGIGGHAAGGVFRLPGGAEITLQAAGQAGITLLIGAGLLYLGAKGLAGEPGQPVLLPPAPPIVPQKGPWTPSQLAAISVVSYVRNGTVLHGEFRRYDSGWVESFADIETPRHWSESGDYSGGVLRLSDGGALIEIDPANLKIYYGNTSSLLDTITSIETR